MEGISDRLFRHKNFNFVTSLTTPEYLDSLESFEIKDSDVFLVTYPKSGWWKISHIVGICCFVLARLIHWSPLMSFPTSGTVWVQQIMISIHEMHSYQTKYSTNIKRMPWLEYKSAEYALLPSPRLFASHLPVHIMPPGVKEKKPKVSTL